MILQTHANRTALSSGEILFQDQDLTQLSDSELNLLRNRAISFMLQEPLLALNPLQTIGQQLAEAILVHQNQSPHQVDTAVAQALHTVQLSSTEHADKYPHQLSGGQRQRVLLAIALVNQPQLLIADEPTTALDAHLQLEILEMIRAQQAHSNMAVLLISHDLNMVETFADRIYVMEQGTIVEHADTPTLFACHSLCIPKH